MKQLDSIFKTIESIKKKYSTFKIKVASVLLEDLEDYEDEKLVKLLSTYNIAQLNVGYWRNSIIKGVPQFIERLFIPNLNCIELNSLKKLRELHIFAINHNDGFNILRYLQVSLSQEQFNCLTVYLTFTVGENSFHYDD